MAARVGWQAIRARLSKSDSASLVAIIHDLYDASSDNRLFLHARVLGARGEVDKYRKLVEDAVYPDPFSRKPVKIAEAKRLIQHYRRATADEAGTADLLLTAVAAGTAQAVDLGYGDESYFASLLRMLETAMNTIQQLPPKVQSKFVARVDSIANNAARIGWGYGDAVRDLAAWPE
jgi:hypothetical protein